MTSRCLIRFTSALLSSVIRKSKPTMSLSALKVQRLKAVHKFCCNRAVRKDSIPELFLELYNGDIQYINLMALHNGNYSWPNCHSGIIPKKKKDGSSSNESSLLSQAAPKVGPMVAEETRPDFGAEKSTT